MTGVGYGYCDLPELAGCQHTTMQTTEQTSPVPTVPDPVNRVEQVKPFTYAICVRPI